ncbi:MAG: trigger factor [Bdellovibrionaceae bacterium]|nr:trigger factor [Pseudobdellovibrionaceae bacterium]
MEHAHEIKLQKVDKLSETRVRLDVEIPEDSVRNHLNQTARRYQTNAKIPGFRPGKAPMQLVQTKFKDQIEKDVVSHLLEHGLAQALHEAKVYPINRPKIQIKATGFNGTKTMQFSAEFEVRPEIKLKKYKGIPVKSPKVEISEKDVNATLSDLADRFATLEPHETESLKKGDFAVLKVGYELLDGEKKTEPAKEFTVEFGEGKLLPEIEEALSKMKIGEQKKQKAKFPENYGDKELAGRDVEFDIELLEAKKKVLPELDDTFAAQVKPGADLKALKETIEAELAENKNRERTEQQRQQVLDYLVDNHKFESPASMVAERTKFLLDRVEEDLKRRGQAFPELTDKDLKDLKDRSEKQVRGSLLLAEIAREESIKLDESKVEMRVNMIATQLNRPADEARKWLDGKGFLSQIRDEVLTDQVFDFLLKNASLTETSPKKAG